MAEGPGHWQKDLCALPLTLACPKEYQASVEKLASAEILEKCLDGFTQIQIEALHGTIWKIAPKDSHHEPKSVQTTVAVNVPVFNEGESVHRRTLEPLSIVQGDHLQHKEGQ